MFINPINSLLKSDLSVQNQNLKRNSLKKEALKKSPAFKNRKAFMRFVPSSNPGILERNIGLRLSLTPVETVIKKFANGETYINIKENLRNKDVFIMQTSGNYVNDNLMEVYLKADASKRMGANRVVALMPNFPYARQERKVESGEPISARLNMSLLRASGVDDVITTDIHAQAMQGFTEPSMTIIELPSLRVMTDYFKIKGFDPEKLVVVSPDLGGTKRAEKFAKELGCEKAMIYKNRTGHHQAVAENLFGNVEGKTCIIYDDIIDTAGTITEAAKMLKRKGADKIYICASHGLFNGNAVERLNNAPVEEVVVTNSEAPVDCKKIVRLDLSKEYADTMLEIANK